MRFTNITNFFAEIRNTGKVQKLPSRVKVFVTDLDLAHSHPFRGKFTRLLRQGHEGSRKMLMPDGGPVAVSRG